MTMMRPVSWHTRVNDVQYVIIVKIRYGVTKCDDAYLRQNISSIKQTVTIVAAADANAIRCAISFVFLRNRG